MHCETYLDAISVQGTISLKFLRALKNMILQFKNKFDPWPWSWNHVHCQQHDLPVG